MARTPSSGSLLHSVDQRKSASNSLQLQKRSLERGVLCVHSHDTQDTSYHR